VKFTIELQGHPDILYDEAWQDVDSMIVHDDTTLSIHYGRPKDALNDWMVYWPKHILENLDPAEFWEWEFWLRPVGNGPYRYVRHVPATMVELEANSDFYAGEPSIDRVRVKFGGPETGVVELRSGNVDVLAQINHADLLTMASDDRFQIHHSIWPGVAWINTLTWNHRHEALSDARVRKALTMGLDRGGLLAMLNMPAEVHVSDVLFTPNQYLSGEVPDPIAYDPDGARALIAAAGWSDSDGDGIVDRDGQSLRIAMLAGSDEDEAVAVFAQAAFRRIGVELEVMRLDESVVRTRVLAGEFDAAVYRLWNATKGHVLWFARSAGPLHESSQFPDIGYHDARVADLLSAAMEAFGSIERERIYEELAPIFLGDVPITFLYLGSEAYVTHRRIRGFESPYLANPMRFLEDFWIER
jgi:peptide/nickel transport system substrate-binding protein